MTAGACELTEMPCAHVAIACCRRTGDSDPRDLYPDPDADPLQAALRARNARSTLVSWDDPGVRWSRFSHVLVSSTWDSVDRPGEYVDWARQVTLETTLVNSAATIEWGLDKSHQRELAAAGIQIVPTSWVSPGDAWHPPEVEFVVKPAVSAGGRQTARYAPGDTEALDHVRTLQQSGQTVMVQPYLSSIDREGEVDIVLFGGEVSHAALKRPVLATGEGVVGRPWERMSWNGLVVPKAEAVTFAQRVLRVVRDMVGIMPTYARVDLLDGFDSAPLLLELELVDPYLSLDMEPRAADRLVTALIGS